MEMMSVGYALLATQSALLRIVTPELRAVVIDVCKAEHLYYVRFYHDGEISEKLRDLWECAMTEASAALGIKCIVSGFVIRLDYPQKIPLRGRYAYLRKEESSEATSTSIEYPKIKREVLDFEKTVGIFVSPVELEEMPTTWGLIHQTEHSAQTIVAKPKHYLIPIFPLAYALLALQRALLGRITPALRNVLADIDQDNKVLYIWFFYDNTVSNAILHEWQWAISLTLADMGIDYALDAVIERADYPQKTPFRGRYAYVREE